MKLCEKIQENAIDEAMRLVRSSKKSVVVTMHVDEELKQPLPDNYHQLLERKARDGVRVVRYGFGSKKAFNTLKRKYSKIQFYYAGSLARYQRMLVVDNSGALFRLHGVTYKTMFSHLAHALVEYIKMVYNQKEVI